MTELASGFRTLPPDYEHVLDLAQQQHRIAVIPLQELKGGHTGARLYLVSVSANDTGQVEHLVLKLDHIDRSEPDESERHSQALQQAPPAFAHHHMATLAFPRVELEDAIAIFYRIAGESLNRYRSLAAFERQSQLKAIFCAVSADLLAQWNAEATFEQAVHPQRLLPRWLDYRIAPNSHSEHFLTDMCRIPADTPGLLIQGKVYPNPLPYARDAGLWGNIRPIDVMVGFLHGDLNVTNILANFDEDGETLEQYYLIDFAFYLDQAPLLYDQLYLQMSHLVRSVSNVPFDRWVDLIAGFGEQDLPDPQQVPLELAGTCAALSAARQAFDQWVQTHHASLSDDLWGQYWLAGVAAGLNFCNKRMLSDGDRLIGLVFAAAHLKRFFVQFKITMPVDVAPLTDINLSVSDRAISGTTPRQLSPIGQPGEGEGDWARWIPQTKLHPPQLRPDLVPRQELLTSLRAAVRNSKLTLIVAPAGYGKTTLLTSLTQTLGDLPLAWLSIDAEDNDPALLLRALIASLQRLNPACGKATLSIQTTGANLAADVRWIMGVLINEILETLPEDFLLVIDDLHWVSHPVAFEALGFLLERLPPQMRLVISSRHEPSIALPRLRARGELVDFRLAEMRFTLDEAAGLLNGQLRLGLSADDLSTLYKRTEGWPAGLRLFASSLQHLRPYGERTALIAELARNNQYIVDLLAEEVFNREAPAIQTFLLQTSILAVLTPDLCQAVTGRVDTADVLNDLYRRNLFLLALSSGDRYADRYDSAYRYHALFADYLQQRLAQATPDRISELHRRAGAAEPVPSRAINHYLTGQAWDEAAERIEQVGEQLLQQGLLDSVHAWIHALPSEKRESRPQLAYLQGVLAIHHRKIPEATFYLEQALHGFEITDQQLEQGQTLAQLSTIAFLQAAVPDGLARIERGLKFPLPPRTRVQLLMERARIAQFRGDYAQSDVDVESALSVWQTTRDINILHIILDGYFPVFVAMRNGLARLEQLCQAAEEQMLEASATLQLVLKEQWQLIHFYRGDISLALETSEEVRVLSERLGGRPPWQHWTSHVFALSAHVVFGHRAQADEIIDYLLEQNRVLQNQGDLNIRTMVGQLYFVAHACWLMKRLEDTRRIYEQVCGIETHPNNGPGYTNIVNDALAAMLLGILRVSEADFMTAIRAFQEALDLEITMPYFYLFGSARVLLAHAYLKQGLRDEALAEIERALAECEQEGTPGRILIEAGAAVPVLQLAVEQGHHKALAGQLLVILGEDQRGEPAPVTIPETGQTLSAREVEVLRLIADGASNRDIADDLVLSVHTVKHHVAHILTKLDVSTRTQAAAKAHELGITP